MAIHDVKILSSRRSYELPGDALRLTMLTVRELRQAIQEMFGFQIAQVGPPMPTFGAMPVTLPPGVIFDYGRAPFPEGEVTPIRFIHFEPQRVVIDVAGSSVAITPIFEHIRALLAEMTAPDGSRIIGEPQRVLDYSELTARFSVPIEHVLAPGLSALFRSQFGEDDRQRTRVLVPRAIMNVVPADEEYLRPDNGDPFTLDLELRSGTRVEDQVYFSGAPLDSAMHIKYLEQLDAKLTDLAY